MGKRNFPERENGMYKGLENGKNDCEVWGIEKNSEWPQYKKWGMRKEMIPEK